VSGDWKQAADLPDPVPRGSRRTVLLMVVGTCAVLLVVAAATGLWSWAAYGPRGHLSVEEVADARQLRGALHAVAAGASLAALVGLALFAVLARGSHETWTRVGVGVLLMVLFGGGGFATARLARSHLEAAKPGKKLGGDSALREAAGLTPLEEDVAPAKGPPPSPAAFWLHVAVAPLGLIGAAVILLRPRSPR
jgi:hypothetical protein